MHPEVRSWWLLMSRPVPPKAVFSIQTGGLQMCQGFVLFKACTCGEADQPGAGCAPIPRYPGVLTPVRGSSFGPFSPWICSDVGCSAPAASCPAGTCRGSLPGRQRCSGRAWAGLAAPSPLLARVLPVPCPPEPLPARGGSEGGGGAWLERGGRAAHGGCATPSLALALLAPRSCRFQVALCGGKDNAQASSAPRVITLLSPWCEGDKYTCKWGKHRR